MSLPQVQSDHHKYNDELGAMDGHAAIIDESGKAILIVSEPATRELSKFLEHRMDVVRGERLVALHNIAVGIMDRFAFDYGSSIKLQLLRDRVNQHPSEWGVERTHDIQNEDVWEALVETVTSEW
jgi:hypothetical protein